MRLHHLGLGALGAVALAGGHAAPRETKRPAAVAVAKEGPGLVFRLSEAAEEAEKPPCVPLAPAAPLDQADTKRVLDRLPPLAAEPEERDFALREASLPPPRAGRTVKESFPPPSSPEGPPAVEAGPLELVRRAPEGEVPLAPHLSLTFSQPMVAVAAHEELAREALPVRLSPEPTGRWRWVGTKTLLFEPARRFPMATEYRAVVPAGVRSSRGAALERGASWAFSTPPPTLKAFHPTRGPVRRESLLFVAFDQSIEPQAVIETVRLRAGAAAPRVRLATSEEVQADEDVRRMAKGAEAGRWLAFRTEEPLPADSTVTVIVGPGTPSAEGPRKTAKAQEWSFRTYGPLRVTAHRCGWGEPCPPFAPWQVELSNPIDANLFRAEMVRVAPELPGLKVNVYGQSLQIRGRAKGRTTYQVTLGGTIPDAFGQTLGTDATLTFAVGPAPPSLQAAGGIFAVLDPAGGPRYPVYSVNHDALKVRAYAVEPGDWPAFQSYLQASVRDERTEPPGRRVLSTTVPVVGAPDELAETRLDLASALPAGLGQLVLVVEPARPPKERWPRQKVQVWVQATRIGLDAAVDGQRLLGWASSLEDGRPLGGVALSLLPGGASGTTAEDGLATLPLAETAGAVLVARRGPDVAVLPESLSWWGGGSGWRRQAEGDALRFFVFDDRHLYKPGEEVRVKGWLRRLGSGERGDVAALAGATHAVAFTLKDSRGNELTRGRRELEGLGGFDFAVLLPTTMNLGDASLELEADAPGLVQRSYRHTFQVQEFRRPEFEVTAAPSEGPHLVGGGATVTVAASYYAGGPLPDAEATWRVSASPASFTPPNRDGFTFGTWVPWWETRPERAAERVETLSARTDAQGRHRLRIDFERVDPPRPTSLVAEATVVDVNRQAWTASSRLLVHPATIYVGLRSERLFVARGEPLLVDAIATDLDGRAVAGRPVTLRAERLEWERQDGEWKEKAVDGQDCRLTSAAEAGRCRFPTREGGPYRVTASVSDTEGRANESELRLWVAGGRMPPRRSVEQEPLTLVPDKKEYRAGETAEVLVMAPFFPAEGLLTLRRSGILRRERFALQGPSHTLRVRIEEAWTPNVHLQVDLVGAAPRADDEGRAEAKLPKRPAFASGSLSLAIPPRERTLVLEVSPREKAIAPGGETMLDLRLRDTRGQAVAGGEVAVVVVDEAVLALTGYRLPDPLRVFYAQRAAGAQDHHLRASVLLARPEELSFEPQVSDALAAVGYVNGAMAVPPPAPMPRAAGLRAKAEAAPEPKAAPLAVRADLHALALFAPSLPTDAEGRSQVTVKLPDSLTRYRVMAVAAADATRFGSGESTITARLPLMARPSPPRFLSFGDRFELPVVLQNQTEAPMRVDVAVRPANAELLAGAGRRVTVPANDRVEVRFPAAARRPGTARFQVGAVAGAATDAAEVALPVWTPATAEAFATYGQIDEGAVVQPVRPPKDARSEFGGLEITTSSTALQALTDAVLYLVAYPFECAEQLSSRVIAVAALKDVLAAFRAEGLPPREEMVAAVGHDLERLRALQNEDGGFGFWRRGGESWPYVSIHAAHALARAKEKGFAVRPEILERSLSYLRKIEGHIPSGYGKDARRTLVAYALSVRRRLGDPDPARSRALLREAGPDGLSFEALGWLLGVLAADPGSAADAALVRRHLANHATETAATAHFAVSYGDEAHLLLRSDRRADAVVLEALAEADPKSDLVPKLVEGLVGHRKAGRWENTQENAFVLLALDRYFAAHERATPDFVARAWLGQRYAGEHAFRGRTTERHHVQVPMQALAAEGPAELVLAKEGPGRLYYRIGLRYAPADLALPPAENGFAVERAYESVDDTADVRRDADGAWRIRPGARVRVRLTMVAPARRYHVALVDPLPAGLEPLNPALATTGTIPAAPPTDVTIAGAPGLGSPGRPGMWWLWTRPWFDHQNMRDERVEAFASLLWEGVYSYSYVARATTLGRFVAPPPRAEEMYHPETFGRGPSDRVVVE